MKELLIERLKNTDLEQYIDNDLLLDYALSYAESEIILRRNRDEFEEKKYFRNKLEGAIWYLSRIGTEGYSSTSENGVSINYKEIPDWLVSVIPRIGVI